ncbi:hypothetical protein RRG08_011244 [Elysia crispata]|uniref:Uncharacterized protein n=1 Tax=Elysia crispata TaxID=231223 RepID=A0AAE1D2E9_9GAST|nr:hypothetical protein RRG08_011244 [Elysia crispata]
MLSAVTSVTSRGESSSQSPPEPQSPPSPLCLPQVDARDGHKESGAAGEGGFRGERKAGEDKVWSNFITIIRPELTYGMPGYIHLEPPRR